MRALLKAESYKLIRLRALYVILACLLLIAAFFVTTDTQETPGEQGMYSPANMEFIFTLWLPAFIGFFIASEFSGGIVRHALSLGKSRLAVYLSKLIFAFIGMAIMTLVVIAVTTIGYSLASGFGEAGAGDYLLSLAKTFLLEMVYFAALTSVFVMFAFISWTQILTALLGVASILGTSFLRIGLMNAWNGKLAFTDNFFPEHYLSLLPTAGNAVLAQGVAVSLAWIVISTAIGYFVFKRRDVK